MLKSVSKSLSSARRSYEACISVIRTHCGCVTCQSKSTGYNAFDEDEEGDEDDIDMTPAPEYDEEQGSSMDNESTDDWDPDRFCEVVITETIIVLSRALSNVLLEDNGLLPTRS